MHGPKWQNYTGLKCYLSISGSSSVESRRVEYRSLVQYALNLVDALLFVHYLAIVLMELRHRQSQVNTSTHQKDRLIHLGRGHF